MRHFEGFVKEVYGRKSTKDRRKKVDWYVCEYKDEEGYTYRLSFEFAPGTDLETVKKSIPKIIE